MKYFIVALTFTVVLFAIGATWIDVLLVLGIGFAVGFGSDYTHRWIESRTGRKCDPRTDGQTIMLFVFGMGGAIGFLYALANVHSAVHFSTACACFFLADMVGHALFGSRLPASNTK